MSWSGSGFVANFIVDVTTNTFLAMWYGFWLMILAGMIGHAVEVPQFFTGYWDAVLVALGIQFVAEMFK